MKKEELVAEFDRRMDILKTEYDTLLGVREGEQMQQLRLSAGYGALLNMKEWINLHFKDENS